MAIGSGNNYSSTTAMGLSLPTPGQCGALGIEPPGKSWLELLNASLGLVDAHNHTPGFGVQVPAAGLNINADLPFGLNNATGLRSARFSAIALGSLGVSDVGCLVVSGADLYYVDGSANQIRLTSGGALAGTPGSISGLASPAAVSYTPASKLFAFTSSSGFVANLSCGPLSIGDASASGGKAATISVPSGLASNYALTLPASLPASTKILTLTSAGAIGATYDVDGTTLQIANSILSVKTSGLSGITGSQLVNGTIGSTQVGTLARPNLPSIGQQISASCGGFSNSGSVLVDVTNLAVTLTTTGRPVFICMIPDGSASSAGVQNSSSASSFSLDRGGTTIANWNAWTANGTIANAQFMGSGGITYLDTVAAGTYTWKIRVNPGGAAMSVGYYKLVAFEL